jgi:uncharacterized protein (TIGR03083 family)
MPNMENPRSEPIVDVLEEVWTSTAGACADLSETEWDLPTECPGWSVRDQLSHLIGIERTVRGDPAPDPLDPAPAHVHNEFARYNEAWIEARRALPGAAVLAEFEEVTRQRLDEIDHLPPERFEEITSSPVGQVPFRQFLEIRVFDSWIHEQDLRRAISRPGGRGGAGEALSLDRVAQSMAFVVGKQVAPPKGRRSFSTCGDPSNGSARSRWSKAGRGLVRTHPQTPHCT